MDAVLPPLCLSCSVPVELHNSLCPDCWSKADAIGGAVCARCGVPFEIPADPGSECGACMADPPPYARHRSLWRYDGVGRDLVLRLKHADDQRLAPALGRWLARAGAALLEEADALIPVPLHRRRLFARRYNQAALLAQSVGRAGDIAVWPRLLLRRRATKSQGGLSREGRARNVAGAFALAPGAAERIAGKRLVLIDDVYTTGATVRACSRTLLRGGARQVDALTLARVVRPG